MLEGLWPPRGPFTCAVVLSKFAGVLGGCKKGIRANFGY